jgi:hypothetical protein
MLLIMFAVIFFLGNGTQFSYSKWKTLSTDLEEMGLVMFILASMVHNFTEEKANVTVSALAQNPQ